jgi:hypothetical protein
MKLALSALIVATTLVTPLHAKEASPDAHAADRVQIQQLVDRFKGAIIAKDGNALHGMFLPGGSWLQGVDKPSLDKVRAKQPDAQQFSPGNYEQFAKFIATAPKPVEETFNNVRIETDGIVGTVYFDYHFLVEGKSMNHGTETWQLVHTDTGWKISAMLYSAILDDMR